MKNHTYRILAGIALAVTLATGTARAAFTLGTTNLTVGPAAGTNSVLLAADTAWTATTNVPWLHLTPANQSGTGNRLVVFTCDENSSSNRTGTLTIAGKTVTVTQAGFSYEAANPVTTLVSSGLHFPYRVAVDRSGNVYIADAGNNAIKKWTVANTNVTTLVASGLNFPAGVAVDGAGNVYIADSGNNAIKKWTAANSNVTTLVVSNATTPLNGPGNVALDAAGNLYIPDSGNHAIKKWTLATSKLTTLVASNAATPLDFPGDVALDSAGNLYIADADLNAIKKWTAANGTLTTLVSNGLTGPIGVAVDGSGNVYIADSGNGAIKKWTAANGNLTTLVDTNLNAPGGVAVDGAGNVFIANTYGNEIKEQPWAFVDTYTTFDAGQLSPGSQVLNLTPVLPGTVNLSGPFTPTASELDWLTLVETGVRFDVLVGTNASFSCSLPANTSIHPRPIWFSVLGKGLFFSQEEIALPVLAGPQRLTNGAFRFSFTNNQGSGIPFTVLATTNLALPVAQWANLGAPVYLGGGQYQITDSAATNSPRRFYLVTSP